MEETIENPENNTQDPTPEITDPTGFSYFFPYINFNIEEPTNTNTEPIEQIPETTVEDTLLFFRTKFDC